MLDIKSYLEITVEVVLENQTLHVQEPTHGMYLAALQHEDTDAALDFIKYQQKAVADMLNRNDEHVKVREKDLDNYPRSFIVAIYRDLMTMCNKAVNDPN